MDMPKVTIALITYNRTDYLLQAINAILVQSYKDFELIIMDNGSTTQTYELVEPYLNNQIKYDRNPINSRDYINESFLMAQGKYLLITHDDDMMLPNMLEREVAILDGNNNCALVSCNTTIINEYGIIVKDKGLDYNYNKTYKQYEYIESFFKNELIFFCPTVMLRKSFFIDNNLNFKSEVGPAHDNYLWFETNLHPVDLVFIAEPLYCYRVHSKQDGFANAFTMELILFPKVIDLLLSKLSMNEAKPYLKLITERSVYNSAFAYHLKKITKREFTSNIVRYKRDLKTWDLFSIFDRCILFLIQHFNSLYILLYKIYVRFKKL